MDVVYEKKFEQAGKIPYAVWKYSDPFVEEPEDERKCAPLLFIPGNEGSYRQARSLGSWLANTDYDKKKCVIVYSADLLRQWSVLSNKIVEEQAKFIATVIPSIRALHDANTTLVIVGHSMGGIVGRLALDRVQDDNTVFMSLAAPMEKAALNIDKNRPFKYEAVVRARKVISISGGFADVQVQPSGMLTTDVVSLTTETMPMVWASVDHQAIVWVHQVIEYVGRTIHSLI